MMSKAGAEPSPVSDQKKRAFDALERRFALVRAECAREEQRKKRREASNKKESGSVEVKKDEASATIVPSTPKTHHPPSNKGNLESSGKTSHRQTSYATDFHPAYSDLLEGINDKLLNIESKVSNRSDTVNKIMYDLLQHGEEGNKFRRTSLRKKIDHCFLLDHFVPNVDVSKDARSKALESHSKRSKKHMSRRQHRKCGSFDMPKDFYKFELFKPMHDMWKAYILELLKESRKKQLAQCLHTADLHGAFLIVVECRATSFVGVRGIMIRETTETFGIIKQDNHFQVVPKRGSVFIFQAGCWKVTLHGDKLSSRNIS